MNYVVWDIETDSAQLDWATMIEIGAILLDENFNAKERFPEIRYTARDLERIQWETRRDVSHKPNITYNVYQPYINVNKRFVAGVYKEEGLMEDLFPMTRSCVGGPNQTKDFTAWCWQCFWCYEKAWAFNLPRTHNA